MFIARQRNRQNSQPSAGPFLPFVPPGTHDFGRRSVFGVTFGTSIKQWYVWAQELDPRFSPGDEDRFKSGSPCNGNGICAVQKWMNEVGGLKQIGLNAIGPVNTGPYPETRRRVTELVRDPVIGRDAGGPDRPEIWKFVKLAALDSKTSPIDAVNTLDAMLRKNLAETGSVGGTPSPNAGSGSTAPAPAAAGGDPLVGITDVLTQNAPLLIGLGVVGAVGIGLALAAPLIADYFSPAEEEEF